MSADEKQQDSLANDLQQVFLKHEQEKESAKRKNAELFDICKSLQSLLDESVASLEKERAAAQQKQEELVLEIQKQARQNLEQESGAAELQKSFDAEKAKLAGIESEYAKAKLAWKEQRQSWDSASVERKHEYDDLSARFEGAVEEARQKIKILETNLTLHEKTKAELENERRDQDTAIHEARQKQEKLAQEIERLKEEQAGQALRQQALAAELQSAKQKHEELVREGARLKEEGAKQSIKQESRAAELQSALDAEKAKLAGLGSEYAKAQSVWKEQRQEWDGANIKRKREYDELSAKFEGAVEEAKQKISALENERAKQEAALQSAQEKQTRLERENERLKEEWLKQSLENETKSTALQIALESEKIKSGEIESQYTRAQNEWKEKAQKWEASAAEQKWEYEKLNTRLSEAAASSQQRIEALETERKNQTDMIQAAAKKQSELEQEIQKLKEEKLKQAFEHEAKVVELYRLIETEKTKLTALAEEYERVRGTWREQGRSWETANAERKREYDELNAKFSDAAQKAEQKIEMLEKTKTALEAERQNQDTAILSARKKLAELDLEIEKLKEERLTHEREHEMHAAELQNAFVAEKVKAAELANEYEQARNEWKDEVRGWEETSAKQKERLQILVETIEALEATKKELSRKIDEALDRGKHEKENFIKERALFQTQLEKKQEEKNQAASDLVKKIDALESEKEKLQGFFRNKVSEITLLQQSAELERAKLLARVEIQANKTAELENKLHAVSEAAKAERAQFQKNKEDTFAQKEQDAAQVGELQKAAAEFQALLERQKAENIQWAEKYAMLKAVKGEFISALKAERKRLIEARDDCAKLEEKINKAAEEVLHWKKEAISLGEKMHALGSGQSAKTDGGGADWQQKSAQLQKAKSEAEQLLEFERERTKKLERTLAQMRSSRPADFEKAAESEKSTGGAKSPKAEQDQRNRLELILELEDQKTNSQEWKAKAEELKRELNFLRGKLGSSN